MASRGILIYISNDTAVAPQLKMEGQPEVPPAARKSILCAAYDDGRGAALIPGVQHRPSSYTDLTRHREG